MILIELRKREKDLLYFNSSKNKYTIKVCQKVDKINTNHSSNINANQCQPT